MGLPHTWSDGPPRKEQYESGERECASQSEATLSDNPSSETTVFLQYVLRSHIPSLLPYAFSKKKIAKPGPNSVGRDYAKSYDPGGRNP